jgi:hypothetical protein
MAGNSTSKLPEGDHKTSNRRRRVRPLHPIRVMLKAPVLSLSSQFVGMVQLALLLFKVGANEATDVYFYLFNLGMVPTTGLIVGVMYPSLLNEHRLSRRDLAVLRWLTPLLCVVVAGVGSLWLIFNDRLDAQLAWVAAFCVANSVVQARCWYRAVAAEAGGNAAWIAGIALLPNVLAAVALLFPWPSETTAVEAMVGGLVIGNLALLARMARQRVGDDVIQRQEQGKQSRRGSFWFFSMASVEFAGQTVLQSLAVLLPASSITLLNVGYKIVGSVSASFVNATMPMLVHADTESPQLARRFLRFVTITMAIAAVALVAGVHLLYPVYMVPAVVVAAWLVTSSASAVAHRMSFRFLSPTNASIRTMIVVGVFIGLAVLSTHGNGFDLVVLLCAYAAIDGASATLLLWPLRDRIMSSIYAVLLVGILCVWFTVVV